MATEGLKQLWKVDIKDCPNNTSRLSERLKEKVYYEENDCADIWEWSEKVYKFAKEIIIIC